jgi:site-specific recombinase XerC
MPAIAYFHARTYSDRSSPTDDPKVKTVLENLRAEHGIEKRAKDPLLFDDLHTVIGGIDRTTMVGRRDRALLLVAFHAALGRSEIVGLNISDIEDSAGGIRLRVRTAGAEPTYVALTQEDSAEAILALTEWMAILKHADPDDPVFTGTIRSCGRARMIDARYVRVLQARIAAAGIKGDYAGESMVTGCQRWMQSRGVRAVDIIAHTRQKSLDALVKRRPHLRDA